MVRPVDNSSEPDAGRRYTKAVVIADLDETSDDPSGASASDIHEFVLEHGGRVIDESEGFLAWFDNVGDAVSFSVDVQSRIRSARIGIDHGDVVAREASREDVDRGAKPLEIEGTPKPTAARLFSLSDPGQTLLTSSAADALDADPTDGVRLVRHGTYRLKGRAEPVEVWEIGRAGLAPLRPPSDAKKAYGVVGTPDGWVRRSEISHNLPAERDAFVGRRSELRQLADAFTDGARVVAVVGTAGVGKSRLARRFARDWLAMFPGGAYFCDLSEAESLRDVCLAVADGLGVQLAGDDAVDRIGHAIAGRDAPLLILDNVEQVAHLAGSTLRVWRESAPDARFLVTSRQPLDAVDAHQIRLDPLGVPEAGGDEDPIATAAVELFVARAREVSSDFELSEENTSDVVELVRRLDGLPLAIELAASRVRILSPAKLAEGMSQRFRLLRDRGGHRTSRQRTLRAALEWSWNLLEAWEKASLAQVSVFRGGIDPGLAADVVDLEPWDGAPEVPEVLESLYDKSLLLRRTGDDEAERYGIYVSIRDFAAEMLRSSGAISAPGRNGSGPDVAAATRRRHAERFASLAEPRQNVVMPGGDAHHRDRLAVELENFLGASRFAIDSEMTSAGVGALRGAWSVLQWRGPFDTAVELAESLLAIEGLTPREKSCAHCVAARALRLIGQTEPSRSHADAALAAAQLSDDPHLVATARIEAGYVARRASDYETSFENFEEAVNLAREMADRQLEYEARSGKATTLWQTGQLEESKSHLDDTLALSRKLDDRFREARTLGHIAVVVGTQGALEHEERRLQEAIDLLHGYGAQNEKGINLGNLGGVRLELGRIEEARPCFEEALAIYKKSGDRHSQAIALSNLGEADRRQGKMQSARQRYKEALALTRELDNPLAESIIVGSLGDVSFVQGKLEEAREYYEECLEIDRRIQSRRYEGVHRGSLGQLLVQEGDAARGFELLDEGESLLREVGDQMKIGELLCKKGLAHLEVADEEAARSAFAEAEELREETGAGGMSELGQWLEKLESALQDRSATGDPGA